MSDSPLYDAWAVIANVSGGDWSQQSDEWQSAAMAWRERFHAILAATEPSDDVAPEPDGEVVDAGLEYLAHHRPEQAAHVCAALRQIRNDLGQGWPDTAIGRVDSLIVRLSIHMQATGSAPERAGREGDTQPMPTPNDHPDIQSAVVADIEARRELGIRRYGTALQPFNGRNPLLDAYEEALDLVVYLKHALTEQEHDAGQEAVQTSPERGHGHLHCPRHEVLFSSIARTPEGRRICPRGDTWRVKGGRLIEVWV